MCVSNNGETLVKYAYQEVLIRLIHGQGGTGYNLWLHHINPPFFYMRHTMSSICPGMVLEKSHICGVNGTVTDINTNVFSHYCHTRCCTVFFHGEMQQARDCFNRYCVNKKSLDLNGHDQAFRKW